MVGMVAVGEVGEVDTTAITTTTTTTGGVADMGVAAAASTLVISYKLNINCTVNCASRASGKS
jgi:hypothetical protein